MKSRCCRLQLSLVFAFGAWAATLPCSAQTAPSQASQAESSELENALEQALLEETMDEIDDAAEDVKERIHKSAEVAREKNPDSTEVEAVEQKALRTVDELVHDAKESYRRKEASSAIAKPMPGTTRGESPLAGSVGSEMSIAVAVRAKLELEPGLEDLKIHVEAKDTTIVLTGVVPGEDHKELAERTALSVPGVKFVDNRLGVDEDLSRTGPMSQAIGAVSVILIVGLSLLIGLLIWINSRKKMVDELSRRELEATHETQRQRYSA